MKNLIVYSSKTGNTKKIAEAIKSHSPDDTDFFSVARAPSPDNYDIIALGFWVDKGMPDEFAAAYMKKIRGMKVGLFMTLGAYPDSEHAKKSMEKAVAVLEANDNLVLAKFICQGKVDPELIEKMRKMTETNPDHPHKMDDKRKVRLAEAAKHPNEDDCKRAAEIFQKVFSYA
jgi:flavodoxin